MIGPHPRLQSGPLGQVDQVELGPKAAKLLARDDGDHVHDGSGL